MAKTKVFVSYDHSEDAHYKRLLQAWDANPEFDFEFDSRGPNVAIDSSDAAVIKAALAAKMKTATHLLVLVGEKSSTSKWISWEIDRAKQSDVKLKFAAIKLLKSNVSPSGLLDVGTSWATSFERDRIIEALKSAKSDIDLVISSSWCANAAPPLLQRADLFHRPSEAPVDAQRRERPGAGRCPGPERPGFSVQMKRGGRRVDGAGVSRSCGGNCCWLSMTCSLGSRGIQPVCIRSESARCAAGGEVLQRIFALKSCGLHQPKVKSVLGRSRERLRQADEAIPERGGASLETPGWHPRRMRCGSR